MKCTLATANLMIQEKTAAPPRFHIRGWRKTLLPCALTSKQCVRPGWQKKLAWLGPRLMRSSGSRPSTSTEAYYDTQ